MLSDDFSLRFGGVGRLISADGLERVNRAHVCVLGIGGVGSWIVEALARSGVGELTLVDLDEVCVSNVNRQLHALEGQVGKPKISVMAERVRAINPHVRVHEENAFYTTSSSADLLDPKRGYTYLVDAIDNGKLKAHLLAACRDLGLPALTCGGAGGRADPTKIRSCDLLKSFNDPLLHAVRKNLRQRYGFPRGPKRKMGVTCVFSEEPPFYPWSDGSVCARQEAGSDMRLNCEDGFGTAAFLTGAFGMVAAAEVVKALSLPPTCS